MIELNLAIIGLIFSILFSSSEIALITANKLQIDVWIKQKYALSKKAAYILDNKSTYINVSLIGTNLANILASSFFTLYFINLINNHNYKYITEDLIFFPIAFIILIFGEIIPKTLIREYSNIMIVVLSPFLILFYYIFYPFVLMFKGLQHNNKNHFLSKEKMAEKRLEFQHVFSNQDTSELIEEDQKEIISNIFDYQKSAIYKVMTPLDNISAVEINSNLDHVANIFMDSGHSKLPIFDQNLNNIKGIVYLYDLYSKPNNLNEITKDVLFVPYSKLIPDLMKKFKDTKHSIAIVLDENGNTAGLITIEDIFEELFGDFEDEFDIRKMNSLKLDDGSYIINTNMTIKDFNSEFNDVIEEGKYETVGGYLINKAGRIPNKNEHLYLDIGHVIVRKGSSRKIEQIQLFLN